MKPGDLVRINLTSATLGKRPLKGRLGIILKSGSRGGSFGQPTLFVWHVLLDRGEMRSFEPQSLELVDSESQAEDIVK